MAVAFEVVLGLLALLSGWLLGVELTPWFHLPNGKQLLLALGAAGGMIFAAWLLAQLRWPPLEKIFRLLVKLLEPLLRHGRWWHWALLAALAGWGEEAMFRGAIQKWLEGYLGIWSALVVASVVFGLLHAITPLYFVLATLAGAYFGLVYHYSGNLLAVAAVHGLYDFWALWYLSRSLATRTDSPALETWPDGQDAAAAAAAEEEEEEEEEEKEETSLE